MLAQMFMFFRDNELALSGDDFSHSVSLQMDQTEVIAVATQDTSLPTQPPCSPTSQASVRTIENETICRICLDRGTEPLVAPCKCAGSAKFAHESCLLQWFFKTRRRKCELCLSEVNVKSVGFKPLQKVSLNLTALWLKESSVDCLKRFKYNEASKDSMHLTHDFKDV